MVVSIIGSGAVGAYLGSKLKDDVRIFEEHGKIGEPVQCSGIFTHNISEFVKLDNDFVINKIQGIKLVSPCGNFCEIDLKKENVVVDRAKFDRYLIERAVENGAKLHKGYRFVGLKDGKLRFSNGKVFDFDVVVGCDGPVSNVRESFFGRGAGRFWVGKQARVKMKNEGNVAEVHFDVPGFFSWVIPENEKVVRIAVGAGRNVSVYFDKFLKKLGVKKVLDVQGGVIPRYNSGSRLWDGQRAFLVGDSGGMVKALSGGGVVPGLRGAGILADVLNSRDSGKYGDYERRFRRSVGVGLWYNLKIREFLDKLDEKEYDEMISILDRCEFGGFDRDNISVRDFLGFLKPELMWFGLRKMLGC